MKTYIKRCLILFDSMFSLLIDLVRGSVPKKHLRKFHEPFPANRIHSDSVILISGTYTPRITDLVIERYRAYYPQTIIVYAVWDYEEAHVSHFERFGNYFTNK